MIAPELRLPGRIATALGGRDKTEDQLRAGDPLLLRLLARVRPSGVEVRERTVARADGSVLRLLVATRAESSSRARTGILHLHGGGYSGGSARGELMAAKGHLDLVDGVVVLPEYRLSTEAPFPAALEDCHLGLVWLKEHAAELGVRSDQIVVAGNAAGGGLTAAVCIEARDHGDVRIAFQMPLYPMIDDRGTRSSIGNDAPVFDGTTNASSWRLYLGDRYGTDDVPPTAAPARTRDHDGLPPTITMVGGVDPVRDETVAYVESLRTAGVPVAFREFPGAWHGFEGIAAWTPIAKDARRWRDTTFTDYLGRYFAEQR
jgi:acetyl esterase/lipase